MNLKEKLLSGQKIYGTMLRVVRNPAICLIAKNSGLDFVMFDCESSNFSEETLHDAFILANAIGLGGFLRAAELSKKCISCPLDWGATGIMVPMTETKAHAEEIVNWSKYCPTGKRGYCGGGAAAAYLGGLTHQTAMEQSNAKIISIAQIETRLGVDNAEEIAGVDGIDVLLVGPNDLSISLGIPGDLMNHLELEAIAHVAGICKKKKKSFGLGAGVKFLQIFAHDLTFVMVQSDTDILTNGLSAIKSVFVKK